jgi:hypothetical protein
MLPRLLPTFSVCLCRYKDQATQDTIIFFDFSDPSAINVKWASESAADFSSLECKQTVSHVVATVKTILRSKW